MADKLYPAAVVVGCTPVGLMAAQTLTDFFERVTLLQLDTCGDNAVHLHDDLITHPQIRIITAREPVVFLLHASGTFAIGLRYDAADQLAHAATATSLAAERAVIADLIVDGRLAQREPIEIEGVLMLHDAPAPLIDMALRNSLTPQRNAAHAHNLTGIAARYAHHLHRLAPH